MAVMFVRSQAGGSALHVEDPTQLPNVKSSPSRKISFVMWKVWFVFLLGAISTWFPLCEATATTGSRSILIGNYRGRETRRLTDSSSSRLSQKSLTDDLLLRRNTFPSHHSITSAGLVPHYSTPSVLLCNSLSVAQTLARGAFLRIASDLSGGTVFESIKTRVTTTDEGPVEATRNIVNDGGVLALWTGTQSRMVEGALVGAVFMLASTITKKQIRLLGGSATSAALAGGLVGGIAQAIVMTPAGLIFTSLNYNKKRPGFENDNAISVTRRIVREKGIAGMYAGGGPMALRQASNWASRAGFTEIARTTLGMTKYGIMGEIGSGVIGR